MVDVDKSGSLVDGSLGHFFCGRDFDPVPLQPMRFKVHEYPVYQSITDQSSSEYQQFIDLIMINYVLLHSLIFGWFKNDILLKSSHHNLKIAVLQ